MKKVISILTTVTIFFTLFTSTAGAREVETDSTRIRQEYLQVDISDIIAAGGIVLLEYDFVANEDIGGLYFVSKGDAYRTSPVYAPGKNSELWFGSNTYTAPAGDNGVQPLRAGQRYHVVCVLNITKERGWLSTYVNGALVVNNQGSGIRNDTSLASFYTTMRVIKGTHAKLTPLENISSLAEFDYSPYLVRVSTEDANIEITEADNAVFEIDLKSTYAAEELINALNIPEGAETTIMHGNRVISGASLVLNGSTLFVQSKNKKQTLEYKIYSSNIPFTSEAYTVNYEAAEISSIKAGTKVSDFKNAIKLTEGFSFAGIYYGKNLIENQDTCIADTMTLLVENAGSYIEYTLKSEEDESVISSQEYFVSEADKSVYGVLKGTPVSKVIQNLQLSEGYSIEGVFEGSNEITDKIINNGILKIEKGSETLSYNLLLAPAYSENGIAGRLSKGSYEISAAVTPVEGSYELSFYDLFSETPGQAVHFLEDGSVYFWNQKADFTWQKGQTYSLKMLIDSDDAETDVFINNEKVLNNAYASWLKNEKNPICLKGNIELISLQKIYSDTIYDEEVKIYNDNFSLTSEYFSIKDANVLISKKSYTADEILSKIQPTHGAGTILCLADGSKAEGSQIVSDGMYILLSRGNIEKRYYIKQQEGGIITVSDAKLYKNEINAETELRNNFSLPMLSLEESTDLLRLGKTDKLIVSIGVSNFNSYPVSLRLFAAGYDENGCITAVSVSDEKKGLAAYEDGHTFSASLDTKGLENAKAVKLYLWDGALTPVKISEILSAQSTARIDSLLDYDETNNDYYRTEIGTKTVGSVEKPQLIINSALSKPNYKGLIFDENGKDDIRLTIKVDSALMPDGKVMSDYRAEVTISDGNGEIIEKTIAENITDKMNLTLSSGKLSIGDYTLRVSLIDKETGEETDFNLHPLRKRSGDISELPSYVDEHGRFIKNGEPKFYTAMYGDSYENPGQIALFENSGIDGVQLYSGRPDFTDNKMTSYYSDEWYDAVYKSGMDFWPLLSVFYNSGYDNHFFELTEEEDEGRRMESIMRFFRNNDSVGGYYIADENPGTQRDRIDWHHDIISSYDLTKPTIYTDYVGGNYFSHNSSADIMSVDIYPVRFARDDQGMRITSVVRQLREDIVNKPVWMALQCANRAMWYTDGVSETAKGQAASEKQLRNMAMQSVANGATGLWWYSYHYLLKEASTDALPNDAYMERNHDAADLLSRPLEVSKLFKKWEPIIMSVEDTASVELSGEEIDYIVKSYNGKTYIFAVNPGLEEKKVTFKVEGATKVKDIYTGVPYSVSSNGTFDAVFGNIDIAVFEVEHSSLLSGNSNLSNIAFGSEEQSFMINYDEAGEMVVYIPKDTEEIRYSASISEKAQLSINGIAVKNEGVIQAEAVTFTVTAENGSISEYPVKFIKEQ